MNKWTQCTVESDQSQLRMPGSTVGTAAHAIGLFVVDKVFTNRVELHRSSELRCDVGGMGRDMRLCGDIGIGCGNAS